MLNMSVRHNISLFVDCNLPSKDKNVNKDFFYYISTERSYARKLTDCSKK